VEFARKANWFRILARLAAQAGCQATAPVAKASAACSPDARLSSFKLDLLLRHYGFQAQEQRQDSTKRAA